MQLSEKQKKNLIILHSLPRNKKWRLKISLALKGKSGRKGKPDKKPRKIRDPISEDVRRKISNSLKGEKSHLWKGGITKKSMEIRKSFEYKIWRYSVFKRDGFRCIWCGSHKNIEADHIKPFAYFVKLRFSIDNGRTLCHECHKNTETYMRRYNNKNMGIDNYLQLCNNIVRKEINV